MIAHIRLRNIKINSILLDRTKSNIIYAKNSIQKDWFWLIWLLNDWIYGSRFISNKCYFNKMVNDLPVSIQFSFRFWLFSSLIEKKQQQHTILRNGKHEKMTWPFQSVLTRQWPLPRTRNWQFWFSISPSLIFIIWLKLFQFFFWTVWLRKNNSCC